VAGQLDLLGGSGTVEGEGDHVLLLDSGVTRNVAIDDLLVVGPETEDIKVHGLHGENGEKWRSARKQDITFLESP